jgi:hypothetical protein
MNEFDDVSNDELTAIASGSIPASPGARRQAQAILAQRGATVTPPGPGDVPDPLEAAATPITPEPMAGDGPRFDNGLPMKTGAGFGRLPGRTQTIDGVQVPVYESAAGNQYYRLGDIKEAQSAAAEAERVRLVEESNARQEAQYGYMSEAPSEAQLRNRSLARAGTRRQAATGAATRQRVERLADQLGVPYNVAYDAYQKAAGEVTDSGSDMVGAGGGVSVGNPMPGLGHAADALVGPDGLLTPKGIGAVMDAATRDLMANSGGVDRRAAQKAQARDIITRRAQLTNNPMEYLGRDDLDDWQRMVLARALVGSSGFTPVEMQAKQNEQLQQLGERFLQGGGGRPLDPAQQRLLDQQADEKEAVAAAEVQKRARTIVGEYADDRTWFNLPTRISGGGVEGWDNTLFTIEEREKATRRLMQFYPNLTYEEARAAVDAAAANATQQYDPADADGPDAAPGQPDRSGLPPPGGRMPL